MIAKRTAAHLTMRKNYNFAIKRIEILKCAAVVFRRRGYYGSTLEAIARAAHIKKSNLYYYFKDKQEILFFWHDYAMSLFLEMFDAVEQSAGSPIEKLHAVVAEFTRLILEDLQGATLGMNLDALSKSQRRKIIEKRDRLEQGIRCILQAGMDEGCFYSADPKLITFAILGAANWVPVWFNPRGAATSKEVAYAFSDYLVGRLSNNEGATARAVQLPMTTLSRTLPPT